jgi:hypothetical protein
MAALDLSAPSTLPLVATTATPGTANLVRLVTLPTSGQYQVIIHNRDKASKDLRLSTDQTLTDGGAAPSTGYITIDNQWTFSVGANRTTGIAPITKLALFSTGSTAVNIEILLNEIR